jgi:methionine synthase II (cobalamin-independent)
MTSAPIPLATGIGSMPGLDPLEAARIVLGELGHFAYVPELPARGVGADIFGRSAALLVDLAIETVPSGYRVATHVGKDQRRGVDLLRTDLDAFEEAKSETRAHPEFVKFQLAGPWTFAAGVELMRGHKILTDRGAVVEFAQSLASGAADYARELAKRFEASVIIQLDEPSLPAVLSGKVKTPSGYGTVPSVGTHEAGELLRLVIAELEAASGNPVVVHCCAPNPPISLLRQAGADAVSLDLSLANGTAILDEIGAAIEAGTTLYAGIVPGVDPSAASAPPKVRAVAEPAEQLFSRLGFPKSLLSERVIPTPTCGLAGASPQWARQALRSVAGVAQYWAEPEQ